MNTNWSFALSAQFKNEGGYVDNPSDNGGATNMGITIGTLSRWRGQSVSKADVKALSKDEASQIYKKYYWDAVGGDMLPSGLDYVVFDYGCMSGPKAAVVLLQKMVGTGVDGIVGNDTLSKIAGFDSGIEALIKAYQETRLARYKNLGDWAVFGKGWAKRLDRVTADALELAKGNSDGVGTGGENPSVDSVPPENVQPSGSDQKPNGKNENAKGKLSLDTLLAFVIDLIFTLLGRR